jgi:hypothetical protein
MSFQKILSVNKFMFERGYSYVGMLGMAFLIASSMQQHWPFQSIPLYVLVVGGVVGTWAIGYFDMKYGFYREYSHYSTYENPMFKEMHERSKQK